MSSVAFIPSALAQSSTAFKRSSSDMDPELVSLVVGIASDTIKLGDLMSERSKRIPWDVKGVLEDEGRRPFVVGPRL